MSSAKNVLHGAATEDEEGKGGESTRGASLKITVKRAPSSTDTVRRGSEPRILGDADDLRLAVQVALRQSESAKLGGGGGGGGGGEKEKAGNTDLPAGELDEDRERDGGSFEYSHGITSAEAEKRLLLYGPNELPEKVIPKVTKHFLKCRRSPAIDLPPPPLAPQWYIFVSQLWQPMPILIWVAAIIEAGIQNWIDMYETILNTPTLSARASLKPSRSSIYFEQGDLAADPAGQRVHRLLRDHQGWRCGGGVEGVAQAHRHGQARRQVAKHQRHPRGARGHGVAGVRVGHPGGLPHQRGHHRR